MKSYGDILHLPRPEIPAHPRIQRKLRAAQFAPFAALAGYGELVEEALRQAEARVREAEAGVAEPERPDEMTENLHLMTEGGSQNRNLRYNGTKQQRTIKQGGCKMAGRNNSDFSYELVEELGVLSTSKSGWQKEINRVSYNGTKPKFDLREWAPGREKMGKGITLNEEEAKELCRILFQYFKKQAER